MNRDGFTLVELLAVIVIIGLLAVIGGNAIISVINRQSNSVNKLAANNVSEMAISYVNSKKNLYLPACTVGIVQEQTVDGLYCPSGYTKNGKSCVKNYKTIADGYKCSEGKMVTDKSSSNYGYCFGVATDLVNYGNCPVGYTRISSSRYCSKISYLDANGKNRLTKFCPTGYTMISGDKCKVSVGTGNQPTSYAFIDEVAKNSNGSCPNGYEWNASRNKCVIYYLYPYNNCAGYTNGYFSSTSVINASNQTCGVMIALPNAIVSGTAKCSSKIVGPNGECFDIYPSVSANKMSSYNCPTGTEITEMNGKYVCKHRGTSVYGTIKTMNSCSTGSYYYKYNNSEYCITVDTKVVMPTCYSGYVLKSYGSSFVCESIDGSGTIKKLVGNITCPNGYARVGNSAACIKTETISASPKYICSDGKKFNEDTGKCEGFFEFKKEHVVKINEIVRNKQLGVTLDNLNDPIIKEKLRKEVFKNLDEEKYNCFHLVTVGDLIKSGLLEDSGGACKKDSVILVYNKATEGNEAGELVALHEDDVCRA